MNAPQDVFLVLLKTASVANQQMHSKVLINGGNVLLRYVTPPYCRAKMYTGHVACCPLVSQ